MSVELNAGSLKAVLSTSETVQAMLAQGPVIINDWVIASEAIDGGYRLTFRRGSEVQTMDILDGAVGPQGEQGDVGPRGSTWFSGTSVTGTDAVEWESGFNEANKVQSGDFYLNTDTFNVYVYVYSYDMITGETAATWLYLKNLIGPKGDKGATGNTLRWLTGTAITGTSTTPFRPTDSDAGYTNAGEMYLNTSTGRVYRCYSGGSPYGATWVYVCNITGPRGLKGDQGEAGEKGETGEKGLYYIPSMTEDGRLEFTASEPVGEELDKITFMKPLYGSDGADGAPGVGVSEITIAEVVADG